MDETGRTPAPADRTVENMIAAVENVAEQIREMIKIGAHRGAPASASDALRLTESIRATYATMLPK